jgi:pimeloyl-ACP methyl ester carboxylesterase
LVESVDDAADRLQRNNSQLARPMALALARGGVSADPAQGGQLAWKWDPFLRGRSPLPFVEGAVQALVRRVSAPVLIVRAEGGYLDEQPGLRQRLSGLLGELTVEELAAGHHLHLERPADVAALLLREWRRTSPGRGDP